MIRLIHAEWARMDHNAMSEGEGGERETLRTFSWTLYACMKENQRLRVHTVEYELKHKGYDDTPF